MDKFSEWSFKHADLMLVAAGACGVFGAVYAFSGVIVAFIAALAVVLFNFALVTVAKHPPTLGPQQ